MFCLRLFLPLRTRRAMTRGQAARHASCGQKEANGRADFAAYNC
jgi:hypothetical protein